MPASLTILLNIAVAVGMIFIQNPQTSLTKLVGDQIRVCFKYWKPTNRFARRNRKYLAYCVIDYSNFVARWIVDRIWLDLNRDGTSIER